MGFAAKRCIMLVTVLAMTLGLAACSGDVGSPAAGMNPSSDAGASSAPSDTLGESAQTGEGGAPSGTALDALAGLPVKGRAPKTGYSRSQFGPAWADVDHNGCDTRNDILNRDLTDVTRKPGTHDCVVASGRLADPYTGRTIGFTRGEKTSSLVQIDHVVALSDAWQKGAQRLSEERREQLANDPYNLLAVDGNANMVKSDGDAATWLPDNKAFRCEYVARQIGVKTRYGLWVTRAEHDAMAGVLASCPGQTVPETGGVDDAASVPSVPAGGTDTGNEGSGDDDGGVSYANCAAVRAAGRAPLRRGDPGYSARLDRDGDGIACE